MQENVGTIDRWARVAIGGVLLSGAVASIARRHPLSAAIMMASGAALLETAITRVCPLNTLLGIDTRPQDTEGSQPRLRGGRQAQRSSWREDSPW